MSEPRSLLEKVEVFQNCAIGLATGKGVSYENYEAERANILSEPELVSYLPKWVSRYRYGSQFWAFIKKNLQLTKVGENLYGNLLMKYINL